MSWIDQLIRKYRRGDLNSRYFDWWGLLLGPRAEQAIPALN